MQHSNYLGLPLLLLAASCVPPAAARHIELDARASARPSASEQGPSRAGSLMPLPPPAVIAAAIAPGPAAAPFALGEAAAAEQDRALDCLTAAVYYEARSEGEDGQRAVAQVVLNRVRHPAFPSSVCGVVYQGSSRSTGCQFSFTCDGSLARRREPSAWERARAVAADALAGYVYEPVGLATHYHTTAIRPWWAASMNRAVTVGAHIFYRWPGEWGNPLAYRRPYAAVEVDPGGNGGQEAQTLLARRGLERVLGITVHRGGEGPAPAPAEAAAFGVRVHRSAVPPQLAATAEDGPAASTAPADTVAALH